MLFQQLREALAASGKERIQDLVKNPLRCSLLCGTWQSLDGDLPDTKAKLYQRFVTTLYQWKEPRLNWIQQQELNAALGKLALAGMLNETSRFQLRESVGYRVMGASLFELAGDLGWLNLVARDAETAEGIYAFYHPTFQEYFAALAVEDWHFFLNHFPGNPQHPDARYRIFEKQWKEVILLWLGRDEVGKKDKEAFIKGLVEFEDGCDGGFYWYRAYFLAAAGIVEFKDCSFADEIVSQIIKWGFGYFNEKKQQWQTFSYPLPQRATKILKETDRKMAIAALVEIINTSQDERTRRETVNILGEIEKNNPLVISTLVELIWTYQDLDTCVIAAYSLVKIGKNNPEAISALVELIRNSGDEITRENAVNSLGEIGKDNPVAISALVELICNSGDGYTRWRAADSLEKIGKDNPVAIAALADLIRNSGDENTRWQAVDILGKIGKDNPVGIQALVELIRTSQNENTRSRAADIATAKAIRADFVGAGSPISFIGIDKFYKPAPTPRLNHPGGCYILGKIMKSKHFATAVLGLKDCLTSEVRENDFNLYKNSYKVIWDCAQNMTYPEFYQAWHTQPSNSPIPDNSQNTDIPTLLKQLEPTDKTFPVPLNIRALEGETDISAIAQELCTQLYQTIFPADTDIPAIRNAPEFKRLIPQLKNRLQTQHIALILHSCPSENALSSFTRKLADSHMGIHIAWITDTALELPLTGFAVDRVDLLDAVQDWMGGIG